jgi:PPP family 3-phenylpropionic acid transporter
MKKIWPFSFYFWQYAGVAFMLPFVVLFYQQLGFTGTQIGLLTGFAPLVMLFSAPLWTAFADATRRYRLVMSLTLLGGSLTIFVYPLFSTFLPILLIVLLSNLFMAPVSSLADSATMSMLGPQKGMYGRLRLGGTIGFALAAPIAGQLVQSNGIRVAFWGCAVMYILCFLISQKFVHTSNPAHSSVSLAEARRVLMKNPRWLLFLFGALGGGMALSVSSNFFFPYMKELGATETIMGLALSVGTICEVPVMFFGNHLLKGLKAYPLFIIALIITGLRLLLFSIAANPNQALVIQLLNGLSFPAMWMAGVAFADENAPAGMSATAQGIFGAVVFGIGTAIGGFTGGALLSSMGARGMYMVFGVILLAIIAVAILIGKLLPAERHQNLLI